MNQLECETIKGKTNPLIQTDVQYRHVGEVGSTNPAGRVGTAPQNSRMQHLINQAKLKGKHGQLQTQSQNQAQNFLKLPGEIYERQQKGKTQSLLKYFAKDGIRSISHDSWAARGNVEVPQGRLSAESPNPVDDYDRRNFLGRTDPKHRRHVNLNVASMFLQKQILERRAENEEDSNDYLIHPPQFKLSTAQSPAQVDDDNSLVRR